MKYLVALVPLCALLLSTGCTQSPEKLVATANKYHAQKKYKEASILYQKAITKNKTYEEAYYREGLNLLDAGSPGEAAKFLRRAVDLNSKNADAETKLAEIYLTAYAQNPTRFKSLLPDIKDLDAKLLQQDPNSYNGLRLQAMVDLADKNIDKALESFARANQIKPYSRDLIGWYAQTLMAAQKPDQALALVNGMLAHDKTWGPGYDFLFMYYTRTNDRAKIEPLLRERVKNDPTGVIGIGNLANYLLMAKRFPEAEATMKAVLNDKRDFPNGHELMGDFYMRAGKRDQALQQYEAGVTDDPKNAVRYRERMVTVYQMTGDRDKALQLAKEVVAKNPKDPAANEAYAGLLVQSTNRNDLKRSLPEIRNLIQNVPNSPSLHTDLSRAYFETGDMDKALIEANEAIRLNTNYAPARIVAGRIYEDRGQHTKAIELTDPVLAAQPQNPDARLIRARAHIGLNEPDKAQAELESLVQQFPQLNDARLQLAALYLARKNYDKASEQFAAVWKGGAPNSSDVRGFVGLQTVKLLQGKGEEAVEAMQQLVQKNPTVIPFRYQLANFQVSFASQIGKADPSRGKGLLQQAADNYKEILKTTANSADVWLRLGVLQRELGQLDAALASFEQAGKANPKSEGAFLNQGMLLEQMGKTKEASDAYNKVLGINPENTLALNNLAYLNAESGANLDQAMTFAQRAKKQVPDSPDVSDTLGYVYYQKNLNAEALQIFQQNVRQFPQNATFHLHLAMALLKQGNKDGAREEAQKALKESAQPAEQNKIRSFVSQIG
jgi:tetratricopeptide (TPR) repeat protein